MAMASPAGHGKLELASVRLFPICPRKSRCSMTPTLASIRYPTLDGPSPKRVRLTSIRTDRGSTAATDFRAAQPNRP